MQEQVQCAAALIKQAEALIIGAGAGMGVDSGLPDFRGAQGFWRAYPLYAKRNLDFASMANPAWFRTDPEFAWGFYGHRLNLYRSTKPHRGFDILRSWAARMPRGSFVFTSNVDGHFERAGFDPQRVCECHGSIHHLQCTEQCGVGVFDASAVQVSVDETTLRAAQPLPRCQCGALARPAILMFGDWHWDSSRTDAQEQRLRQFMDGLDGARVVVVECGAGTAIPSVRRFCEGVARSPGGSLIRINVREPQVPRGHVGIAAGAADTLEQIDEVLSREP